MNTGTRMTDGCHHCEGRFSQTLPKGAPRARARFVVDADLRNPELVGRCLEIHLHGWNCEEEIIQTVRLTVDPQSREVRNGEPAGVHIVQFYETPPEWPPALRTVRGSRMPGEQFMHARLTVGGIPEFCHDVPPDEETTGGEGVLIATVPIAAMWTYSAPERK